MLKTNKDVASLGFNRKEIRSLAQKIADDSELGDDATDEEEDSYIKESIEDMVPVLKVGQQYANRLASENSSNGGKKSKKDDDDNEDDEDDGEDDEDDHSQKSNKPKKSKSNDGSDDGNDGEPSWFKKYRESMDKRFEKIESSRTGDSRKSKVEKILKDANVLDKPLGKRTLRDFGRMNFNNDDEFEDFLDEIAEDVEDIGGDGNVESVTTNSQKDITPPKGGKNSKKNDVASDDEIKNLADMF